MVAKKGAKVAENGTSNLTIFPYSSNVLRRSG